MPYFDRKTMRLNCFDYSTKGVYFLTICTHDRKRIFSEVIPLKSGEGAEVRLSAWGKIAESVLNELPGRFPGSDVLEYMIMPDHIHLLIKIPEEDADRKRTAVSQLVGYYKMNVSKRIHAGHPDMNVWQRGYYDHVVRNEEDFRNCAGYIQTNPIRWLMKGK